MQSIYEEQNTPEDNQSNSINFNAILKKLFEIAELAMNTTIELADCIFEYFIKYIALLNAFLVISCILNIFICACADSILPGLFALLYLTDLIRIALEKKPNNIKEGLQIMFDCHLRYTLMIHQAILITIMLINIIAMVAYLAGVAAIVAALPGPTLPVLMMFAQELIITSILLALSFNFMKKHAQINDNSNDDDSLKSVDKFSMFEKKQDPANDSNVDDESVTVNFSN